MAKKRGQRHAALRQCLKLNSQHLDAHNVQRISFHVPSHCYVVAFVAFEFFRIRNREHFLIAVSDDHHFSACFKALLGALGRFGIGTRTLSATLGVGYVTLDGSFVSGKRHVRHHEQHYAKSKTEQKQLFHSEYLLNFAARPQY